ncbi:hypothetical protein CRG98_006366 [Punica granatum]|uniref:Uncharacterized protein n=1 Tax=Punica granatum TaxID=22663 RepID=A0A2I0KXM6_PUNGR|nr:hypothetical protein CRG98_006366 [Punica granatum]
MGSEKCKNSGNDLSRGKGAIHGPRKPKGALGHLPWAPGCGKSRGKPEKGLGKSILPPGMNRPKSVQSGRLAVRLVGAVPIDRGGLFVRGRLHWIPKGLRIMPKVVSGGEHM